MWAYLHPLLGGLAVLLLGYVAVLGFQLRTVRRGRAAIARRHARLAPLAFWLVAGNWALGAVSTLWWRTEPPFASSLHFRSGSAMLLLLAGSALSARAIDRGSARARALHPWLGAAAVLLAAAHVVAGLRIMP